MLLFNSDFYDIKDAMKSSIELKLKNIASITLLAISIENFDNLIN